MTTDCAFCAIAQEPSGVSLLLQETDLLVFMDHMPIREGHCMIMPKTHYPYFDDLPSDLAARAMTLAQEIARAMKNLYQVERVAFFATGTDVAHAHLHLVPMHHKHDLTSARYMAEPPRFADIPITAKTALDQAAERLRATMRATP